MNRRRFFGLFGAAAVPSAAVAASCIPVEPAQFQTLTVEDELGTHTLTVRLRASEVKQYESILQGLCQGASLVKSAETVTPGENVTEVSGVLASLAVLREATVQIRHESDEYDGYESDEY